MITSHPQKPREEFKSYYDLRYKVLREPWGMQRGTEKDDFEPSSQTITWQWMTKPKK